MRAMSVEGGPFKRSCTESVVFKWIKGVIYTKDIIECTRDILISNLLKATNK